MKLLYTPNSPYARKVRIVAIEKHIDIKLELVVLNDPDNGVKQHNPLGKVPVLVLDENESLYDSRVIVEYLDHRTPVSKLLPSEHGARVSVLRWQALADGVCDAAIIARQEQQTQTIIEHQLGKVVDGLATLNKDISKKKWCVNETFSLADVALGCMLGYVDARLKAVPWQDEYPNLAKHYSILIKRPSFKETAPHYA